MPRVSLEVDVATEEAEVRSKMLEAAETPAVVVGWFTSDESVDAEVKAMGDDSWALQLAGPGFKASGSVVLLPRQPGAGIGIDVDVKPRGLLGTAGVLAAVASGQLEREIRQALWNEFGEPS